MRFPIRAFVLAGAALFIAGSAEADSLSLTVGELRRQPVTGVVANVVVADPTVADVMVIDQHSVVILGKGYGVTQVLATDHAGHVLIDDRIVIAASEAGHMTLYRGLNGSDYSCTPNCRALDALSPSGGASAGPPPTPVMITPPVMTAPAPSVHP